MQNFDINSALKQFRSDVEEKIRKGAFDLHGSKDELMERNSYVYSDIRAGLLQKMKRNTESNKNKFTLNDLEEVAETDGSNIKNLLARAYVSAARRY